MPNAQQQQPMTLDHLLTETQVTNRLELGRDTLYRFRTQDENPLPYVRIGQSVFYFETQLVEWLLEKQARDMPLEAQRRQVTREAMKRYRKNRER